MFSRQLDRRRAPAPYKMIRQAGEIRAIGDAGVREWLSHLIARKPVNEPLNGSTVVFGGQCFLCGGAIEAGGNDPLQVTATTPNDKWEVWWAHAACFKSRITDPPEQEGFFTPTHF